MKKTYSPDPKPVGKKRKNQPADPDPKRLKAYGTLKPVEDYTQSVRTGVRGKR